MGKENQSVLAREQGRLEVEGVGSKYPTYVAFAEGREQQKLDEAIVKGLDQKLRVEVLSPAQALAKGYKVGKGYGGFGNLLLFRRHEDPESKFYYPLNKWRIEMRTQESFARWQLLSLMGASSLVEVSNSSRTTTASSSSSASADLSDGVIGALTVELGLKAATTTTQSVAAHFGKMQTWDNPPTKKPTMPPPEHEDDEPKTYFVKHAKVHAKDLGGGIASATLWDLALDFRETGYATTKQALYVSSTRATKAQSTASRASLSAGLSKAFKAGLGVEHSSDKTDEADVVSVYIITFWQKNECAYEADPVWAPAKVMPEGASSTTAVRSALAELLENRQERQQGAASALKRVSLSVSKRVSGAIASRTLSNTLRVGIAGPVGAGKTSLATSLSIALERLVPYWSEEITGMFDSYKVRKEEIKRKNDGTTATPYKERVVFGADGEGQLVLCDMKGLTDVTDEGDEFAAYLADDQRSILHRGFELATGRAAPTPDVVFLVFDGEELSSMTDKEAVDLLKPYAGFMGKVRTALKKPRLPFLIVVTKMDKVQAADTKARDKKVARRISVALPDDELDVHFVRNYTREELDHNTKVVEEASKANKPHKVAEAKRNYEAVINTCRGRSSELLDVVLGALSAVSRADSS